MDIAGNIDAAGEINACAPVKPTMRVKVFLCGYRYPGRKINLADHSSYDSLYCGLHRLFRNFDKLYDPNDSSEEERYNSDITFYYLDREGNTSLVGDIPWELFLVKVKKLFIVDNSLEYDNYSDMEGKSGVQAKNVFRK